MKNRNLLCILLATALVLSSGVSAGAVKKPTLPFKKLTLVEGQKKQITIKNRTKKAVYTYTSSAKKFVSVSKTGMITAKKPGSAKITVKEQIKNGSKKKTKQIGIISVTCSRKKAKTPSQENAPSSSPAENTPVSGAPTAAPQSTAASQTSSAPQETQPAENTQAPVITPEPTPDLYTTKVLSIDVTESDLYTVDGSTCHVDMQYFSAEASGDYFTGSAQKEGTVVIKDYIDGDTLLCSRYILSGKDADGNDCSIFIEDNGTADETGKYFTKPIILTDSKSLSFLETADLQGRITDQGDKKKTIDIFWNKSNTKPVAPPPVVRPDDTLKYDHEIFTILIDIGASDDVKGNTGEVSMIHFGGSSDCENFKGIVISDCVDTQRQFNGQTRTLSARYILSGTDANGTPCKIYVENNGINEDGVMVTEPIVITDSPDYAWVETAKLHGTTSWVPKLTIHIATTEE